MNADKFFSVKHSSTTYVSKQFSIEPYSTTATIKAQGMIAYYGTSFDPGFSYASDLVMQMFQCLGVQHVILCTNHHTTILFLN